MLLLLYNVVKRRYEALLVETNKQKNNNKKIDICFIVNTNRQIKLEKL